MSEYRRAASVGVILFLGLAGAGLEGSRQTPASARPMAQATGLILGQVIDADTGLGIPGALVVIAPSAAAPAPIGELTESRPPLLPVPTAVGSRRALTAADGRFLFRDLPKGRFNIAAASPAYVQGAYGQLRPHGPVQALDLADGEQLGNLAIKLWRNGSISGVVRDESGEPAVGVSMECWRRVFTGGQKRLGASTRVFTDDRGIYRVPLLPPGDYICGNVLNPSTVPVSVAAFSAAASETGAVADSRRMANSMAVTSAIGVRLGDVIYASGVSGPRGPIAPPPDANGRVMAYTPQFYGGAATTAQASIITLKAGEDRSGIDIQLKIVPAVRIGGRLMGPDGPVPLFGLTLVPASGNDLVSEGQATFSRTTSDVSGAFTFMGIPAGEYVLKGRLYPRLLPGVSAAAALDEGTLWVSTPVTAGNADQLSLTLIVRAGLRVTGRVEFTGSRTPPTPAELQRIGVRMQMAEGRTSSPIAMDGRVLADGTFKTAGYAAGRYIANVLPNTVPAGWFVKSITANGRDVSVEPMELSDADVAGLLVTFTDTQTTLTGSVTGGKSGEPGAEVIVFPADSLTWKEIGPVARRSRVERANADGAFAITGLPPGDYFVAAVPGSMPGDRQDPALLATLMRDAARVTLIDAGSANIQVAIKR